MNNIFNVGDNGVVAIVVAFIIVAGWIVHTVWKSIESMARDQISASEEKARAMQDAVNTGVAAIVGMSNEMRSLREETSRLRADLVGVCRAEGAVPFRQQMEPSGNGSARIRHDDVCVSGSD